MSQPSPVTLPEPVATTDPDDAALLNAYVKDRSEAAFRRLVDRHANLVYGAALRRVRGDAHLAKDVSQRVFVDLARKAATLGSRRDLCGWLHTSTRFAASHLLRSEERRRLREEAAAAMNETTTPAPDPSLSELTPVLDEAIDSLGKADREAVLRRFFRNESFAQVAVALATTEDGARMRVKRALAKLEQSLAKRGVFAATAGLAGIVTPKGLAAADGSAFGAFLAERASASMAPSGLAGELSQAAYQGAGPGTGTAPMLSKLLFASGLTAAAALFMAAILYRDHQLAVAEAQARLVASTASLSQQLSAAQDQLVQVRKTLKARAAADASLASWEHSSFALRIRPLQADRYAALWRELKLDPATLQKTQRLVLDRGLEEIAVLHDLAAGDFPGLSASDPKARTALTEAADKSVDIALRTVLGDADFARFCAYTATADLRMEVVAASAKQSIEGPPLTDAGIDQVTAALAAPVLDATSLSSQQQAVFADTLARRAAVSAVLKANAAAIASGQVKGRPVSGARLDRLEP